MQKTGLFLKKKGFTLVELIAVTTMIGILVGVMTMPAIGIIKRTRFRAEQKNLAMLASDVKLSFRQDDLNMNLSALEGDMPADATGLYTTTFDTEPPNEGENVNGEAWYARLTKLRGQPIVAGVLSEKGGDIHDVAYNAYGKRRVMIVGPFEEEQQRYIMLSFMFPGGPAMLGTTIPRVDIITGMGNSGYKDWFDNIYDHAWGEINSGSPEGGWDATWGEKVSGNQTYSELTVAVRIVQPRYRVTVNNLSPISTTLDGGGNIIPADPDRIFIYSNLKNLSHLAAGLEARVDAKNSPSPKNASVQLFPDPVELRRQGILEGRRVLIRRKRQATGTDPAGAETVVSVLLNENTTYTAQ